MSKKSKSNPLVTHFTIAIAALAMLWLSTEDKDILVLGNSLILVYVVYALASRFVIGKKKNKHTHK
ncbi:hypothetical protein [Pseudoalteromonas luteoviolacea]|uniref:Uncharacterized protein n=1 Tax=Pseudoalteromonas luteoviolacea DSM 6061 TaxID=1365250 RepID=A0A166VVY1_9GAMM|nr:hypothetical protein [Pseudoalteromonas luteoviolacea]KZN33931.1 hypothetical protein N475_19495 [Pseudoalteromonas luteoviolacea DSM 6061]KZN53885.1 hypothetical protein N474_18755 [Pseudoalteromonas luteoviolacea CPMOR-2]MBE0385839.1 hypothetical protein [Pseudoalteromonas luteoviolacea DSM 6061]TQF70764.1 hypothetical protein FLM44_06655 [Pseudoalteromonas luteoviolacea]